jgi:hypothetical protein
MGTTGEKGQGAEGSFEVLIMFEHVDNLSKEDMLQRCKNPQEFDEYEKEVLRRGDWGSVYIQVESDDEEVQKAWHIVSRHAKVIVRYPGSTSFQGPPVDGIIDGKFFISNCIFLKSSRPIIQ